MQVKSLKWLDDIRDAAVFIRDATQDKSVQLYRSDRMLRQAVERNFEIIGEAIRRLAEQDPTTAALIGDYPQIISFRNLLIHGYDVVDDNRVWQVIQHDLPSLLTTVDQMLADAAASDLE